MIRFERDDQVSGMVDLASVIEVRKMRNEQNCRDRRDDCQGAATIRPLPRECMRWVGQRQQKYISFVCWKTLLAPGRLSYRARHIQPAAECRVVGEELVDALPGEAVEGVDVRRAGGTVHGDDAGLAGAGAVDGGHANAAGEGRVEWEEAAEGRAVDAGEDRDAGAAAGAGRGANMG